MAPNGVTGDAPGKCTWFPAGFGSNPVPERSRVAPTGTSGGDAEVRVTGGAASVVKVITAAEAMGFPNLSVSPGPRVNWYWVL